MDVVDREIFATLTRLDPSFFGELSSTPESLNDLNDEKLYEAIVLLLWVCDPNNRTIISSKKRSQSMTTRFQSANGIVSAIQALGVRDPIDYQTVLYGRSKELRNILIGLIEKLPKTSEVVFISHDLWKDLFRSAIKNTENLSWDSISNVTWTSSKDLIRRIPFMGFNGDFIAALCCDDWRYLRRAFLCSLLEYNFKFIGSLDEPNCKYFSTTLPGKQLQDEIEEVVEKKQIKPPLKPKPAVFPKPTETVLLKRAKDKLDESDTCKVTIEKIQNDINQLKIVIERKEAAVKKFQNGDKNEISKLEELMSRDKQIDKRLHKLIESPESLSKLNSYIESSNERMSNLQNVWLGVKSKKGIEVQSKRLGVRNDADEDDAEIIKKTTELENEIAVKLATLDKLKSKAEENEKDRCSRDIYTKYIFEIANNIKKQQEEIDKVTKENIKLQKEIISMAGKLDRTYTVVEDRLYKDVEKDVAMKKAYKLLAKIHEVCSYVFSSIDVCGQLRGEIEKFNYQIAVQQQKKIDEKLESIINDWMEVKNDNKFLLLKLANSQHSNS